MNSFNETEKRLFANSTSKDNLEILFLCFNSEKVYDEIGKISVVLESKKIELSHQQIEPSNYTMVSGEVIACNLFDNIIHIIHTE